MGISQINKEEGKGEWGYQLKNGSPRPPSTAKRMIMSCQLIAVANKESARQKGMNLVLDQKKNATKNHNPPQISDNSTTDEMDSIDQIKNPLQEKE